MKTLFLLFLGVILFIADPAVSEQKIAFINMDKVMSTSKPGVSILKQLTDLKNKNSKFLKEKERKFNIFTT